MKIQLSLPLKTAKNLPHDKLFKLVKGQARRIELSETETLNLIQVCEEKGCLDKGLSVLYEFSGYMDRINILLERRSNLSNRVSMHIKVSSDCSNNLEFIKDISKLAETSAKLLYTVAVWRKLNWNPRPIYNDLANSTIVECVLPTVINNRNTLQNVLRDQAYQIMSSTQDNEIDLFSILSLGVLVVLLSPVIDKREFTAILNRRESNSPKRSSDVESPELVELPKSLQKTFKSIRNILAYEDDIDRVWTSIRSGNRGTDTIQGVMDTYPIIRIPYKNMTCEYEGFRWYSLSAITEYSVFAAAIAAEIKSGSLAPANALTDVFPFSGSLTSLEGGGAVFNSSLVLTSNMNSTSMNESMLSEASVIDNSGADDDGIDPGEFFAKQRETQEIANDCSYLEVQSPPMGSPVTPHQELISTQLAPATAVRTLPMSAPNGGRLNGSAMIAPPSRTIGIRVQSAPLEGSGKSTNDQLHPPSSTAEISELTNNVSNSVVNPAEMSIESNRSKSPVPVQDSSVGVRSTPKTARKGIDSRRDKESAGKRKHSIVNEQTNSASQAGNDSQDGNIPVSAANSKERSALHTVLSPSLKAVNKFLSNKSTDSPPSQIPKVTAKYSAKQTVVSISTKGGGQRVNLIPSSKTTTSSFESKLAAADDVKPSWAPHETTSVQHLLSSGEKVHSHPSLSSPDKDKPAIVGNSSFQLYQYFDGNFIPVCIQPAIPVSGGHSNIVTGEFKHPAEPEYYLKQSHHPPSLNSITKQSSSSIAESDDDEDEGIIQKTPSMRRSPTPPARTPSGLTSIDEAREISGFLPHAASGLRPSSSQSHMFHSSSPKVSSNKSLNGDRHSAASSGKSAVATERHSGSHSGSTTPTGNHYVKPTARAFNSKQMESLGILASVSSLRFRGEMLADSQVMSLAFKYVDMGGGTLLHLAARKIALWWKLCYPRKRFLKRMNIRTFIVDIVMEMATAAVSHSIVCKRRRLKFLREGGATKIQRCFRHYRDTILAEEKAQELLDRKQTAVTNLNYLCKIVKVCAFVYRFVKYVHKKFLRKRKGQRRIPTFRLATEMVFLRIKDVRLREALEHINANSKQILRHNTRAKAFREREAAAIRLQNVGRIFFSKKIFKKRKFERGMRQRILSFFIRSHYIFGKYRKLKKNQCAAVIQKRVRGMILRKELAIQVKAGMLLNQLWRKHRAFRTLKQNLRRVEKPVNIIIRGIRNIPSQLIHTESIRIKVSVWWHPLLHIISESDFSTIIQNKQPQFIYFSKSYPLVKAVANDSNADIAKSTQKQSRGSSFLIPGQNFKLTSFFRYTGINSSQSILKDQPNSASSNPAKPAEGAVAPPIVVQETAPMLPSEMTKQKSNRSQHKYSSSASGNVGSSGSAFNRRSGGNMPQARQIESGKPPIGHASASSNPNPNPDIKENSLEEDSLSMSNSLEDANNNSGHKIAAIREDSLVSALSDPTYALANAYEPKKVEAISSAISALSSGDDESQPREVTIVKSKSRKSLTSKDAKRSSLRKSRSKKSFRSLKSDDASAAPAEISPVVMPVELDPLPEPQPQPENSAPVLNMQNKVSVSNTSHNRVSRSTAFFRGRIGTMLSSQTSFANKLSMVTRLATEKSLEHLKSDNAMDGVAPKKESSESESSVSEDEDEQDDDNSHGSSSSSNSEDDDGTEANKGSDLLASRNSMVTKRPPQQSIRKTLLKGAQMLTTALIGESQTNSQSHRGSMADRGRATGHTSILAGIGNQIRKTVARVTGAAGGRIGGLRRKKKGNDTLIQPKFYCKCDDYVRIPGCHGNSVVKFDFFDGERKIASHLFFMAREGHVMFWGGEYTRQLYVSQARRVGRANAILMQQDRHDTKKNPDNPNLPYFDYSILSGSALKSRAQWAKIAVKGNGPAKRAAHKNIFMAFFFTSWKKLFLSMDADGLSLFERKSSISPLIYVPLADMDNVRVEQLSVASGTKGSRSEDNCCVVVTTKLKDEIFIRCQDVASRFAWNDTIAKAISDFALASKSVATNQVNDLFTSVTHTTKLISNIVTGGLSKQKRMSTSNNVGSSVGTSQGQQIDSLALSPASNQVSGSFSLSPMNSQSSLEASSFVLSTPKGSVNESPGRLSSKRSTNLPTVQEHRSGSVADVVDSSKLKIGIHPNENDDDDEDEKDEW